MENTQLIDLDANESRQLDELRSVLLRSDREVVEAQRRQIDELVARVHRLEQTLYDIAERKEVVDEVLVDAITSSKREAGELGLALRPEVEHAIFSSARTEDTMLAEAIYPVLGPAIRKMIADLFTLDKNKAGQPFVVEQVLLIERSTGLLLASTATNEEALEDADVVSGMIDALKTFVQEAFTADENDGLSDLRVGDLSVLVESGPNAILASVVRGIPSQDYRNGAAEALEGIHGRYASELALFDGSLDPFVGVADVLGELHANAAKSKAMSSTRSLVMVAVLVMVTAAVILLGVLALS